MEKNELSVEADLLTRENILAFIRLHKQELEKRFGLKKIALFGSYARNEATISSDIDLLIELEEKDFDIRCDLKEFLEQGLSKKIDIGYFDSVRSFIMRQIQKDLIYA